MSFPNATVGIQDHTDAANLAAEAGRLLIHIRRRLESGASVTEVKDEADRRAHEFLVARLRELHPGDAVLSEEGADDGRRFEVDRVWIVDPLDGTREFGEPPRDDWAVHVALVVDGAPLAGAVALPARELVLSTVAPPQLAPRHDGPPRLVVSRTRPPPAAQQLAVQLGASLIAMGSAGAKVMAVVLGDADIYLHAGGQYEWDSAAPVAVAIAAGLHTSRLDGSALRYNRADPWLPDLLVCRPELVDQVLEGMR